MIAAAIGSVVAADGVDPRLDAVIEEDARARAVIAAPGVTTGPRAVIDAMSARAPHLVMGDRIGPRLMRAPPADRVLPRTTARHPARLLLVCAFSPNSRRSPDSCDRCLSRNERTLWLILPAC